MKVVVIGGTGHIGSFLVPRLVRSGHQVINISRGTARPYFADPAWEDVETVVIDREKAEADGTFVDAVTSLNAEIVIDLICFTRDSAQALVDALDERVSHFLHCGTVWVHGHSEEIPTTENSPRRPFGEYGKNKAEIEAYLLAKARKDRFPVTIIHPGHIVGPGWWPLNPQGNFNPEVFRTIKAGKPIAVPNIGLESVHHVHADDVARGFTLAIENWSASVGESFHIVSPQALTLRGYAEKMYRFFGRTTATQFVPWETLKHDVSDDDAWYIWDHIGHSPCCSIEKARNAIGYYPRFSSIEAITEALRAKEDSGDL